MKVVERQILPSTPAAANFHSLRVYFQVNEWKGNPLDLDTKEWGGKEKDGQLLPIPTDQLPAPDYLTEVIRCNGKTGCNTLRCIFSAISGSMEWNARPYVEIAKVYAVRIPLQFRLKVMRTRGANVDITKKVSLTESEKYNVLHIQDRDQMSQCVYINL